MERIAVTFSSRAVPHHEVRQTKSRRRDQDKEIQATSPKRREQRRSFFVCRFAEGGGPSGHHLTRFTSFTDLSPRGGEVKGPLTSYPLSPRMRREGDPPGNTSPGSLRSPTSPPGAERCCRTFISGSRTPITSPPMEEKSVRAKPEPVEEAGTRFREETTSPGSLRSTTSPPGAER